MYNNQLGQRANAMSGSGHKPGANIDTDKWGNGTSDRPDSETNPDPTDEDWDWLNQP